MDDCIFCKIARRDIPVKAIAVNDHAVAFLDINPVSPGHAVAILKKHAATILDVDDDGIAALFSVVREATQKIKLGLQCDGFNIGLNQERAGGQAIPHLHVHIIPRYKDDGGGSMHSIVRNPSKESIDVIYRKIKDAEPAAQQESDPEPAPKKEEKLDIMKKIPKEWDLDF